MSAPADLNDLLADELADLWSANDQMQRAVKKMADKASDDKLEEMLHRSQKGIEKHSETIKTLLKDMGEDVSKEHCKGMEGLVAEAHKHTTGDHAPEKGAVLDAVIIAQYQRMSHYGIAGFGTAASFANTLGLRDAHQKLSDITKDIYRSDEYLSKLAETSVNIEAEDA